MRDDLNEKKSIVNFKQRLVKDIPYTPNSTEAKQYLLGLDIGGLLHIYHFWRQRLLQPVARRYCAPAKVRNDPLYVGNKTKIENLRQKIEAGLDVSAYLSRRAHTRALDVDDYRQTGTFNNSRDQMLVCEGFYHLHLAPFPERTDEVLVAVVEQGVFEVIGIFTHELFLDDRINPEYPKYNQAVNEYLARKLPTGGIFMGGAGGGMQNAAGSSVASTFWQIHCRKTLRLVEAYDGGLEAFTIKLYNDKLGRQTNFVDPRWEVADDCRLLIRDRKNKHEFWKEPSGTWRSRPSP
ncbi:hypothetical protein G6052_19305 [Stenotrophomonas maltophilia]|nr:hypothetical protein G6052_19305 [Stenotrophomonas maltophilia]